MARGKRWKTITRSEVVGDALDYYADIEELAGEMRSWEENLSGANMEHMTKYDEVSECADLLEEGHQAVEEAVTTIHDAIDDISSIREHAVTFVEMQPYGRKGPPRHMTLANALAPMAATATYLEELDDDDKELEEELDDHDTDVASLRQLGEELSSALGEMESVDFPGMY